MSFSSIGIVVIQYRRFMEAASRFSPSFRFFPAKDFYSQDLPIGHPVFNSRQSFRICCSDLILVRIFSEACFYDCFSV